MYILEKKCKNFALGEINFRAEQYAQDVCWLLWRTSRKNLKTMMKINLPTVPAPIIPIRIVMLALLFPCSVDFTVRSFYGSKCKENGENGEGAERTLAADRRW